MASYSIGNHTQKSNTFLLIISASDINNWVTQNIPAYSTINSVTLTFTTKKSYTLSKGDIEIKVGGSVAYDEAKQVESDAWNDESYELKNYVQSGNANAGRISGDVQIFIDGPWTSCTWNVNNISINYNYTAPTYYTATFKNWDGTELQRVSVRSGQTPSYTGATPTKAQDNQYTYAFNGWKPDVGAITGDTTYTAQFKPSLRTYTVSVECRASESGEKCSVTGEGVYHYGDTIILTAVNVPPYHDSVRWYFFGKVNSKSYDVNPLVLTLNDEFLKDAKDNGFLGFTCAPTHSGFTIKANVLPDSNVGAVEFGLFVDMDGDGYHESWFSTDLISPEGYLVTYDRRNNKGIEAIPKSGYRFVKWQDGNTENPRRLTISSHATYTAVFELDKINNIFVDTSQSALVWVDTVEASEISADMTKVYG